MHKNLIVLLCALLVMAVALSGCGGTTPPAGDTQAPATTEAPATAATATEASTATEAPVVEPSNEKVTITLLQTGWVAQPRGDNDPYNEYINDKFNVDFQLESVGGDFTSVYMVRFASDDPPDMIAMQKPQAEMLHAQGLSVEDWGKYQDKLPKTFGNLSDMGRSALSSNGNLIALSAKIAPQLWSLKVRQDWLNNLGLQIPTTVDELLTVARAFVNDDPTGTGIKTYAFTSAGSGADLGEIQHLQNMFGPDDFYPDTANGKASHPIVDGTKKMFLDFMRTINTEGLIAPDWYTIGWSDRGGKHLPAGDIGFWYYPGVIVQESDKNHDYDGTSVNFFETMQMPKGTEKGGKLRAVSPFHDPIITASKKAEADAAKFDRMLQIIEAVAEPDSVDYRAIRWGIGIEPGMELHQLEGGFTYINQVGVEGQYFRSSLEGGVRALFDWGFWFSTGADLMKAGSVDEPNDITRKEIAMDSATMKMECHPSSSQVIANDPQAFTDAKKVKDEFEIKYILGDTDDYDGFVDSWLKAGGQKLLDDATEQFKALGLL